MLVVRIKLSGLRAYFVRFLSTKNAAALANASSQRILMVEKLTGVGG